MAKFLTTTNIEYNTFSAFFLALFVYICALFLFIFQGYMVKKSLQEQIRYTNQQNSFIDIYVIQSDLSEKIAAPKQSKKQKEKKINKNEPKEAVKTTNKETLQDEISKEAVREEPSLSELFKNFKPQTKQAVQSNKQSQNSAQKSTSDIVKSLNTDTTRRAPKSGASGIYNKFLGDVTQIIEEKWSIYKADTNNDAKIQIFIDKFGKLSYNIISLSPNSDFNDKVRDFLWQLKDEQFPIPPSGQTSQITLNLVDKITTEQQ